MTFEQLRVFVAVAEREHMTQAARELHLAQSAVSASITKLEWEHETRLFDRVGRGIQLTREGRVFLQEARAILLRVEQARVTLNACKSAGG